MRAALLAAALVAITACGEVEYKSTPTTTDPGWEMAVLANGAVMWCSPPPNMECREIVGPDQP